MQPQPSSPPVQPLLPAPSAPPITPAQPAPVNPTQPNYNTNDMSRAGFTNRLPQFTNQPPPFYGRGV